MVEVVAEEGVAWFPEGAIVGVDADAVKKRGLREGSFFIFFSFSSLF